MARIEIKDLDDNHNMSIKNMKKIYGGSEYDRYQNINTGSLLTKIEYYTTITSLTSNYDISKK